jgi:predicted RNA-binding protein with TRAM domain
LEPYRRRYRETSNLFLANLVNFPGYSTNHVLTVSITSRRPWISFPVSPGVVAGETMSFPISVTKPSGFVPALKIDNLPGTASFTDNGDGTRQFEWATTEADIGQYSFTIIAPDARSGESSDVEMFISVLVDPALADGDQVVIASERVVSLEIENVELSVAFDYTMNFVNAKAGFLVANTDLIINNDIWKSVNLVPGINRIALESVNGSQRILLSIDRILIRLY